MNAFIEWPDSEIETTVPSRFEQMAAAYPSCLAVQAADAALTYAELNTHANHLARQIVTLLGVGSEPVVVLMDQSLEQVTALLAILKAGHFFAALETARPDPPLRDI